MSDIRPFPGLRPRPELVARVASPPYDVLSSNEAREMARGNGHSFLRVVKAEIDLDAGVLPAELVGLDDISIPIEDVAIGLSLRIVQPHELPFVVVPTADDVAARVLGRAQPPQPTPAEAMGCSARSDHHDQLPFAIVAIARLATQRILLAEEPTGG